jgi:spore maturation protein CgeB
MDVVFVPGAMRFSAHVDAAVERALRAARHSVRTLCRQCLATIGQGALADVKTDLVLTVHGRRFPHALLKQAPHIRAKAVWLLDEPQEIDLSEGYGRHFDIVFTNDRNTCGVHGPHKSWYLPLAADPQVHGAAPPARDLVDVTFVGGILPERVALLDQAYLLAPDLSWRIVGPDRWHKPVSFAPAWENRAVSHQEYVEAISSARIVLDIPRDETVSFAGRTNRRGIPATGVGCRPFEVTACGRFLLTDDSRADIARLFPAGTIGIYRAGDAADLVAQVRYWLQNAEEREERAALARAHCLREHTYAVRVRQLVEMVEAWLDTRLPGKASSPRPSLLRPLAVVYAGRAARPPRSEGPKK